MSCGDGRVNDGPDDQARLGRDDGDRLARADGEQTAVGTPGDSAALGHSGRPSHRQCLGVEQLEPVIQQAGKPPGPVKGQVPGRSPERKRRHPVLPASNCPTRPPASGSRFDPLCRSKQRPSRPRRPGRPHRRRALASSAGGLRPGGGPGSRGGSTRSACRRPNCVRSGLNAMCRAPSWTLVRRLELQRRWKPESPNDGLRLPVDQDHGADHECLGLELPSARGVGRLDQCLASGIQAGLDVVEGGACRTPRGNGRTASSTRARRRRRGDVRPARATSGLAKSSPGWGCRYARGPD